MLLLRLTLGVAFSSEFNLKLTSCVVCHCVSIQALFFTCVEKLYTKIHKWIQLLLYMERSSLSQKLRGLYYMIWLEQILDCVHYVLMICHLLFTRWQSCSCFDSQSVNNMHVFSSRFVPSSMRASVSLSWGKVLNLLTVIAEALLWKQKHIYLSRAKTLGKITWAEVTQPVTKVFFSSAWSLMLERGKTFIGLQDKNRMNTTTC